MTCILYALSVVTGAHAHGRLTPPRFGHTHARQVHVVKPAGHCTSGTSIGTAQASEARPTVAWDRNPRSGATVDPDGTGRWATVAISW